MKSSDKVYGALSRLEDQLVGDMTIRDGTTVQHMLKRIEYAHEAVRGILKMALVDEPHEDPRRTAYVVGLEKKIEALKELARDIRDNWDHDDDAHRYGTSCRVCMATEVLKEE